MASGSWTDIARLDAKPQAPLSLLGAAGSRAGVSTLVVDTGMLLNSNVVYSLPGTADQFVTVAEAVQEVRDAAARVQLATLPFKLVTVEPSQDALSKVVQFARATGDVHSLSNVDLKLLALTYMLEVQAHGSSHLRTQPPPLQVLSKGNSKHKDPPGWGSNVPNLEEWEEIGNLEEDVLGSGEQRESRILDLQTISFDDPDKGVAADATFSGSVDDISNRCSGGSMFSNEHTDGDHLVVETNECEPSVRSTRSGKSRNMTFSQKEPVPSGGKSNVAVGVDATKGLNQEETEGWEKACSRSTRRKHQKRAARVASRVSLLPEVDSLEEKGAGSRLKGLDSAHHMKHGVGDESGCPAESEDDDLPDLLDLEDDSSCRTGLSEHVGKDDHGFLPAANHDGSGLKFGDEVSDVKLDVTIEPGKGNEVETEENPGVDSTFRSSIGCMTADYAMQNVLLQIGLRLVSAGGMQVKELHRWVLKCQACNHVTADAGRLFCPKCGNGGTLYRMSVTVGADGIMHSGRQRRVNLRGTRYSLPLPKGGREGALKNPILREDQLPRKLINPKSKKASSTETLDICEAAEVFRQSSKAVANGGSNFGSATAILSGRRNPNERRVSRRH